MEIDQEATQQTIKRKSSSEMITKEIKTKEKKNQQQKQSQHQQKPKRKSAYISPVTVEDIEYNKNDDPKKTKENKVGVLTFFISGKMITMCPKCLMCWPSNNGYKHVQNYITVEERIQIQQRINKMTRDEIITNYSEIVLRCYRGETIIPLPNKCSKPLPKEQRIALEQHRKSENQLSQQQSQTTSTREYNESEHRTLNQPIGEPMELDDDVANFFHLLSFSKTMNDIPSEEDDNDENENEIKEDKKEKQNKQDETGQRQEWNDFWNSLTSEKHSIHSDEEIALVVVLSCVRGLKYDFKKYNFFVKKCTENGRTELKKHIMNAMGRDIFNKCRLTKEQCDLLNSYFNSTLDNHNEECNLSYTSTVRYGEKMKSIEAIRMKKQLEDATFISISIDSTRRGDEEIYAICMRIVTDVSITDTSLGCLRFSTIKGSPEGKQIAEMVIDELRKREVPLEKIVSVTTDGDKSMIGKDNGCIEQIRIILEKVEGSPHVFQGMWCADHRLHLVAGELKDVAIFKIILTITEVVCESDVRYEFERWKKEKGETNGNSGKQNKPIKLPALSNTRWLFHGKAMIAILSQFDEIAEFLRHNQPVIVKVIEKLSGKSIKKGENSFRFLQRLHDQLSQVQLINIIEPTSDHQQLVMNIDHPQFRKVYVASTYLVNLLDIINVHFQSICLTIFDVRYTIKELIDFLQKNVF